MSDHNPVRVELAVAAPLKTVWWALRDPAEIRRWHGWEYDQLEAEIDEIFFTDVTASESDHTLETGGGTFVLAPLGEQTLVQLVRPAAAEDDAAMWTEIDDGWLTFLQQLRFALERHPGEDRRTLFLSGEAPAAEAVHPAAALGLDDHAALQPARRYEAITETGEILAGEVWFRSSPVGATTSAPPDRLSNSPPANQLGLTIDNWGDGLLVLTDKWVAQPPHLAATAVITTYGLDDAAFDDLGNRWSAWWAEHYQAA